MPSPSAFLRLSCTSPFEASATASRFSRFSAGTGFSYCMMRARISSICASTTASRCCRPSICSDRSCISSRRFLSIEIFLVVALEVLHVPRDRANAQDRVPEDLELLGDAVVQARVRVVRAAQHQDADAIFRLDRVEDRAALLLDVALERVERLEALFAGEVVLVFRDVEAR